MPRVIAVEIDRCLGCHSCELACALAHSSAASLYKALQQRPLPQPRLAVVAVGEASVPVQCRHCEAAPCVTICPKEALQKPDPDGPVIFDPELCTACQLCIIACPFGVISMSADGKTIIKCDMCVERLERGEEPACVSACPTRSLALMDVEAVAARARERTVAAALAAREEPVASGMPG